MTGENYELALALAKNDKDLLEDIHEILMESGVSDEAVSYTHLTLPTKLEV